MEEYQDQRALNILLASSHRHRVRLAVLDAALYPNGWNYFVSRLPQRTLGGELPAVIHNNWLQGFSSKVHRFREELLWTVDPDSYYAAQDLKYGLSHTLFLFLSDIAMASLLFFFSLLLLLNLSHTHSLRLRQLLRVFFVVETSDMQG